MATGKSTSASSKVYFARNKDGFITNANKRRKANSMLLATLKDNARLVVQHGWARLCRREHWQANKMTDESFVDYEKRIGYWRYA